MAVGLVLLVPLVGGARREILVGIYQLHAKVVDAAETELAQGNAERGMTIGHGGEGDNARGVGTTFIVGIVGNAANVDGFG